MNFNAKPFYPKGLNPNAEPFYPKGLNPNAKTFSPQVPPTPTNSPQSRTTKYFTFDDILLDFYFLDKNDKK